MTKRPIPLKPKAPPTADEIRDISVKVYLDRLGSDAQQMQDEVGAKGVRSRAGSYDPLTRAYLKAIKGTA